MSEPQNTARTSQPVWTLAPGFIAGVVVAVVLAAAGLALARPDLVLLALPLIAASAWAWQQRPDPDQPSTMTAALVAAADGSGLDYTVILTPPRRTESVSLRLSQLDGPWQEILVTAETVTAGAVTGRITLLHSGPQTVLRIDYRLHGAAAALLGVPRASLDVDHVATPPYPAIASLPIPVRLRGLTGNHDSVRPGDGGDLRDIHPFAAGDRLRRIDWKATARRGRFAGDLYVRRTAATADATILLVLDSRDDVGEQVAQWARNDTAAKGTSALDLAREAASALAAGYLRAGDRVGFQDLASQARMVAPAAGSRHLWRLLRVIEATRPSPVRLYRQRPPVVPAGALIYVLSSLLDDEAARMAMLWRGGGHRVIAVDVLPAARFDRTSRFERIAHRIVVMQRADRIKDLQARGVEILVWRDDQSAAALDARLRQLSTSQRGRP